MGWGDDASRCFTTKNKGLWGWARPIWLFPLVKPYRKSTPGGGGVAPCKQSQRIIKQYAPIAKASRQAKQARRRRSPCRLSVCFARGAVFGVLHWPNTAQKQSHTHNRKAQRESGNKHEKRKAKGTKARKHKEKQAKAKKSRSGYYIKIPKQAKRKATIKDKQL